MQPRRLPPAVESLRADAALALGTGVIVTAVAAAAGARPELVWRSLAVGAGTFFLAGVALTGLFLRRLVGMRPPPLPSDATPHWSVGSYLLWRLRRPGRLVVLAVIAVELLGGDPYRAVFFAAFGVGVVPGHLGIAWFLRRWELRHGTRLVREVDRHHRPAGALPFYALPAGRLDV